MSRIVWERFSVASGWLRGLLRRIGVGERRWIPPNDERKAHTELVRERLPKVDAKEPEATHPE